MISSKFLLVLKNLLDRVDQLFFVSKLFSLTLQILIQYKNSSKSYPKIIIKIQPSLFIFEYIIQSVSYTHLTLPTIYSV